MAEPTDHSQDPKGFKVVDRRSSAAAEPSAKQAAPAGEHQGEVLGPIDFSTFLISLASSALIHLGETPHPDTGGKEISLPHAQQTIDLLALLEVKTSGNLTPEETKLLHTVLRDLRMRFVAASGK